jgi:predicted DNA-binding ribbon-helix-helix protein
MRKLAVNIGGQPTNVYLEDAFGARLEDLSRLKGVAIDALVSAVDQSRGSASLSFALKAYILTEFTKQKARS